MNTPTTPELVPFNSGLRSRVRTIVVRAPDVQDARFLPGPSGAMPLAAVDHAAGLMRSGLAPNQIKYLAELHPVAEPMRPEIRVLGGVDAMPPKGDLRKALGVPSIDDILGDAELRLELTHGRDADAPVPVRHFGDDMKIEVQPKPAAFMVDLQTAVLQATEGEFENLREVLAIGGVVPQPGRTWSDEAVDAARADRAATDEATCARLGLALPPAFFALGTTLVDIGVDNARKSREEFECLPPAREAMASTEAEVVAEDRKSFAVGLSDLTLADDGRLCREGDGLRRETLRLGLEADAARQLQLVLRQKVGIGGDPGIVTGLEFGDAAVVGNAARMWNRYAAILREREGKGTERKQASLLTRMVEVAPGAPRQRQVFAAVSEKYAECDAGKIAHACGELVGDIEALATRDGKTADVRAEVVYDRKRVSIDLLTHTTVRPDEQVVGDVFRTGLRVRSDDTGGGSLVISSVAFRIACRNYTVVSANGAVTRIRHIGDPARLLERLQEALAASSGALATFAVQWSKACGKLAARALLRNLETDRKRRAEMEAMVATILATDNPSTRWHAAQAEVLDGIYRSMLTVHDLTPSKLVEDEVTALRRAYHDPRNVGGATPMSPAAISNGLTLWAQDKGRHTADAAEVLAGQIVSGDEVLAWIGAPARAA